MIVKLTFANALAWVILWVLAVVALPSSMPFSLPDPHAHALTLCHKHRFWSLTTRRGPKEGRAPPQHPDGSQLPWQCAALPTVRNPATVGTVRLRYGAIEGELRTVVKRKVWDMACSCSAV
jgi:hypothetical protein